VKVLVGYASKRGSTAEIAEEIAGTMRDSGLEVDVAPAGAVKSLADYEAVVLGSAIYMKRWQGDARHFLRRHGRELESLPFWVFSSGPVGDPEQDNPDWAEPPRIVDRVERLGGRGHVVFGGRLPPEPRGPIEKAMVKNTPPRFRDRRDWDEIRAWSTAVAAELLASRSGQLAG
jgi:menaquinone-dependent protoporphyrinogen oxidase